MSLGSGSIAFTGFNADNLDNLSFVTLEAIAAGTVIYFTDTEWEGSDFANGEAIVSWTAAGDIAAGTIITLDGLATQTPTSNAGAVAYLPDSGMNRELTMNLGDNNEIVYAYVGSLASPTFLAAIANNNYASANGSLANTGLVDGLTAFNFNSTVNGADVGAYVGPRSGFASFEDYLAAINNPQNWVAQTNSGDQSGDGTAPDLPFDLAGFTVDGSVQTVSFAFDSLLVEQAEGNSGATSITFTLRRTGGTTGTVDFSGNFAHGTTDDGDFGGVAPAGFAGTIADGADSATVTITLTGDSAIESDERFTLTLQSATNASATVVLGAAGALTATGAIVNDDFVHTVVANGETRTDSVTITSGDTLTIKQGGTLAVDGDAIFLTDPLRDALLDNAGLIEATGLAINADNFRSLHDVTVVNRESGVIRSIDDDAIVFDAQRGAYGDIVIDNAGLIEAQNGRALEMPKTYSSSVTIYNRATGVIWGASDAMRPGDASIHDLRVKNDGLIYGRDDEAIDLQEGEGTVDNGKTGVIDGGNNGIGGDRSAIINNAEGGIIRGRQGSGVNFDGGNITVNNRGLIEGGGSDGDGVDIDFYGVVRNWGSIHGKGGPEAEGIAAGYGKFTNYEGGEIYGDGHAILIDDSDGRAAFGRTDIVNHGTITSFFNAAVKLIGGWDDTLTNSGMILGGNGIAVDMGGGNDTVTMHDGSLTVGTVMLGDGNDKFFGSSGNERVDGGAGADLIQGRGGFDLLAGGTGGDTFLFKAEHVDGTYNAYITDISFADGDRIELNGFAAGTFADFAGLNSLAIRADGGGVVIDSFTDLKELAAASGNIDTGISGDDAVLNIPVADGVLQIRLQGAAQAYIDAPEATAVNGTSGNDTLLGAASNDVLTGNEGNDRLDGKSGADSYFGGTEADTFVFRGTEANGFTDFIRDLTFAEGDRIELLDFETGTFAGVSGGNPLQVLAGGGGVRIDSMQDLVELAHASDAVTVTRIGSTNRARLTIDEGDGDIHQIFLDNQWAEYVAAGGLV
jgi:hypothetical protein